MSIYSMIVISTSRVGSLKGNKESKMKSSTVTVNGTVYDSRTGKPLRRERGSEEPHHHHAKNVHAGAQRSRTLNRRYVRRQDVVKHSATQTVLTTEPQTTRKPAPTSISVHKRPAAPTRSNRPANITKYARPAAETHHTAQHAGTTPDIAPTPHAVALAAETKVQQARNSQVSAAPKPSQVIKNESIQHALQTSTPKSHKKEVRSKKQHSKTGRFMSVASASLAIVLLGAYLTYLNMPSLSTRVAAAQAGIDASYPSYKPSGYSLTGTVAYQQGSVTMTFAANAGPQTYTLVQKDSSWDSSAVLEHEVEPEAGDNYTISTASGLTIYSYNGKSTWVNNGILYTITGDAKLSSEQVQNIATSL